LNRRCWTPIRCSCDASHGGQVGRVGGGLSARPADKSIHWELRRRLGDVLLEMEKFAEAQVEFEKALTGEPWRYETHNSLGVALQRQGALRRPSLSSAAPSS